MNDVSNAIEGLQEGTRQMPQGTLVRADVSGIQDWNAL